MAEKKKEKPEERLGYALGGFAGKVGGQISDAVQHAGGVAANVVKDPLAAFRGAPEQIQQAGQAFSGAYGGIPGAVSGLPDVSGISGLPNIGGIAGGLGDPLSMIRGLGGGISDLWKDAGGGVSDAWKGVYPSSSFQASVPDLNRVDFANAINRQMGQDPAAGFGQANASGATQGAYANSLGQTGQAAQGSALSLGNALAGRSATTDAQQQQLIGQLQGQASGQGPGSQLAQNMLQQATNNNAAQGAGLIASQRGINPALAARQAAMLTANANQQAAMQGSNLGLQNQLAAQSQLAGILGNNQALNVQGAGSLFQGVGNNNVNAGANVLNAQRAGDVQVGNDMGALQNQRYATNVQGQGAQNQAINQGSLGAQELNQKTASGNAATSAGITGGLINATGAIGASAVNGGKGAAAVGGAAHGGRIPGKAEVPGDSPKNDKVPINVSPGEIVVPRTAAGDREAAKAFIDHLFAQGGGGKAKGFGKVAEARDAAEKAKKKRAA